MKMSLKHSAFPAYITRGNVLHVYGAGWDPPKRAEAADGCTLQATSYHLSAVLPNLGRSQLTGS